MLFVFLFVSLLSPWGFVRPFSVLRPVDRGRRVHDVRCRLVGWIIIRGVQAPLSVHKRVECAVCPLAMDGAFS